MPCWRRRRMIPTFKISKTRQLATFLPIELLDLDRWFLCYQLERWEEHGEDDVAHLVSAKPDDELPLIKEKAAEMVGWAEDMLKQAETVDKEIQTRRKSYITIRLYGEDDQFVRTFDPLHSGFSLNWPAQGLITEKLSRNRKDFMLLNHVVFAIQKRNKVATTFPPKKTEQQSSTYPSAGRMTRFTAAGRIWKVSPNVGRHQRVVSFSFWFVFFLF